MGAALPLVRSLYTWSMRSEMWLYALLNNSVLNVGGLQDSCHQRDAISELVPPLLYIVERISCVLRIFTGLLSFLFCLGELDLDIIKPKQRGVSVLATVKLIKKNVPVHGLHIWCHTFYLGVEFRYRRVKFAEYFVRGVLHRHQSGHIRKVHNMP